MNAPCAVSIVRAILLIGLALCAAQHCAAAEEQHEGQEQLGSIAFEDDNGRVRFPISLRGREFSFVLSTGDNYSCIDSSYRPLLGPRIGEVEQIGGFASKAQVAVHHCPPGMLAGYPLGLDSIASRDLTRLSSEFDRAVDGELGFDILRHWVVEIDWDRHRLRLSQALPDDAWPADAVLKMTKGRGVAAVAAVAGRVNGRRDVNFCVATNAGHHAMLAGRDVQGLAAAEAGIVMPNADGEPVGRLARLDDIELGRIYDRDAVCAVVNGADFSALGCDFWRQYRVTFDFPRDLIYLGKRANTPPSEATMSGLIFFRQDRSKIVYHVFPGSPADKAGVLKGDRLTRLDGKAADEMLLSEIRAAQRSGVDKKVEMQFDRDGRQIEASVTLRRLL